MFVLGFGEVLCINTFEYPTKNGLIIQHYKEHLLFTLFCIRLFLITVPFY